MKRRGWMSLAVAVAVVLTTPAFAQMPDRGPPEEARMEALARGDRVRVTFFESIDLAGPRGQEAPARAPLRTFYQRIDLTGEYLIDLDGTVMLPRLGVLAVGGLSPREASARLAEAFEREMGRTAEVHVAVIERPPVYVVGLVRAPGAHRHVPGMLAVQAIALAGGYERSDERIARLLEARRERDRAEQTRERLFRLMAREARLRAELDGALPAEPPAQLVSLAGPERARALMAIENRTAEITADARRGEHDLQEAAVSSAQSELQALRASVAQTDRQIRSRMQMVSALQDLDRRGLGNRQTLNAAQTDVTDFELRRQQLEAGIFVAEQRIMQAERGRARLTLDHRAATARELMAVEDERRQLELTGDQSQFVAAVIEADAERRGAPLDARPVIEIVRRTPEGPRVIEADETTDVLPGDVVRVSPFRGPGARAQAGAAPR